MNKINSNQGEGKGKQKKLKKNQTKKGDFLDFAQEKGIEFKLQYEDKEENKKNFYEKNYNNNQGDYKSKNFQGNNFKYQSNKKQFGFQNKPKNNKFDQANTMFNQDYKKNMMTPYSGDNYNMQQQGPQDFNFDPFFSPERTLEEILCYIFSPDYLNRDLYFRKRISDGGLVDVNQVMNYNK